MASGIRLLVATSALAACTPQVQGYSIFVSPTGSDSNPGTSSASPLATCAAAVQKIKTVLSDILLVPPAGGIEVLFAGGTYPLTADTACGTVTARGTEAAPIIFRPANVQDAVIFDGTAPLPKARLVPVTNATILQLVNPSAQHSIRVMPVSAASGWTGEGQQLQWGQFPLTPSVWPDEGLGYVQKIYDSGDIYCPGRTKGPPPVCQICTGNERSSAEKPCGANFSLAAAPTGSWGRELEAGPGFGGGQVTLDGYLGADWFHESHTIARVQKHGTTTSVQLGESSHYGICESLEGHGPGCAGGDEGGAPGRFRVRGLLSNVDMPGEYFFDRAAQMLYLIPPRTDDGNLGFWSGPGLVAVTNSSFVTVRGFTVAGSTGTAGAIAIAGGSNNTVGGCTVHSCNSGIMLAGGHENKVVGNDVYDVVYFHVSTSSNAGEDLVDSQAALVPTNNLVSNNQFTQVWLSTTTWSIHSGGIGDRFSNNILHDAPGQLILPGGPLTMWDRNEVFNTGYAEGDGGMIYLHASLVKGYGMHLRENFLHHSLDVPGLIGRHAVQFDDHFGAVSNCSGNVLYKAAGIGLASSGSGNNITNNLIMNSGMAIAVSDLEDMTVNLPAYDNGTLKRGDKMDYVWNAEDDLGLNGSYHALFKTALAARFPSFARQMAINSTQVGWASAGNSMLTGNVFINNSQCNICFEDAEERNGKPGTHTWHGSQSHGNAGPGAYPIAPLSNASAFGKPASFYLDWSGSVDAEWAWFPDSSQLEFVNTSLRFDTRRAGLYCDEWRRSLPDATKYRPFVKNAFADVMGLPEHGHYTPAAAELRSGLRTGQALVLNFTVPCPLLERRDCYGVWLAWGECGPSGQSMRYTVEYTALAGGAACPWRDGHVAMQKCS